jgi:hypothetical protein
LNLLFGRLARLIQLLLQPVAPVVDHFFAAADVARYHRNVAAPGADLLDDATWDDMLLSQFSAQLAQETSIFGQQELHHRLRGGVHDGARVRDLLADDALRRQLQDACLDLRRAEQEASTPLFDTAAQAGMVAPRWAAWLGWLPPSFLLALVLSLVTGWMALWGAVIAGWVALLLVQVRFHAEVAQWERHLNTLQQMLRAHVLLAGVAHPLAAPFRIGAAQAGRINRAITRSPLDYLPAVREYSDWLWQKNLRHHFASRALVARHAAFLRDSFRAVAELEADLALARHLSQQPRHCWAARAGQVELRQVVHPLLDGAAPLTFALQGQGAFISGQNGIGKSTLLRTVGLNLIVARAFGYCYAEAAALPLLPVYSSMQSEDALGSESLYLAELRRAQELLALGERAPALFIIDEIFRGTNHLESVSAAAAVLHTLADRGTVIVSSHNVVLATLLEDCLAPWCVSAPGGDRARLVLAPGVLADTNGIALLASRGFGPAIAAKAARVFDWLSRRPSDSGRDCSVDQVMLGLPMEL